MDYRPLGRTGVQVSPLCLGCMNFGWGLDQEKSNRIIHAAIDASINFLDVANVYGGHKGESEEVVGNALEGRRDGVFLATKVHGKMGDGPNDSGNHRFHIVRQCEESLRRLKTDRIDLYQIHRPQPEVPIDETLRALDDLIKAGKVLYIGASTFAAWQLMESIMVAKELGLNRFVCEQPPYNVLDRRVERELIPFCQTYGLGVIPWSPIAGGLLTGKYGRDRKGPVGSRYERGAPATRATDAAMDAVEKFVDLADDKGCTPSQLALAWCMSQPGITAPIMGPNSLEQLQDNLGALDVKVTDEDRASIDEIVPPGTNVSAFYTSGFGPNERWS